MFIHTHFLIQFRKRKSLEKKTRKIKKVALVANPNLHFKGENIQKLEALLSPSLISDWIFENLAIKKSRTQK